MLYLHLTSSLDVQHSNPSDPVPQMEELEEMVSKALKTAENSSWAKPFFELFKPKSSMYTPPF